MKKIAIFANDAGGSEMLLELLKSSLHVGVFKLFCTENSPCNTIVKDKNLTKFRQLVSPNKEHIFALLELFNPDIILYATSWQNHYEYYFLEYAKKNDTPSIAFLDNWTNYKERFGYPHSKWRENFPDFIATHDKKSEKIATSFNLPNLVPIKNYSLLKQIENFKKLNLKPDDRLLFLSEPTAKVAKKTFGDENYWGFNEQDVFKSILKYKEKFDCKKVVVRLHPSDIKDIYVDIDPDITISTSSLEEDIARAKIVIGIDSSVLYLAFLLGKKTLAFMPSKNRDFFTPLPKSNQVRDLKDVNKIETNTQNPASYGIDFALFIKKTLG